MPPPEWLERANRLALTARLLSSTVHDVNNALQVIAGSVELLQMAPAANEMVQRRITAIDTQAKRASRLLQDLTEFVRDARSLAEPIELKALAEQVLASRHYAVTKLRITAAVEGEAVRINANPKHVQQILLNLLVNAEDAKCSTLVIRVGKEGDQAVVIVENNAGNPEPGTGNRENLGIGLEVSEWLAQKNGGTVTFEPAADGSRAKFSLPASS
ncbi:MAG TPA: HAMP domain-containing sensor histidine kinase [Vicinamibacterales bacterium]|nr:HAMP domain-containing sensor histidine kinase [Vicinamibacterales bacterium]